MASRAGIAVMMPQRGGLDRAVAGEDSVGVHRGHAPRTDGGTDDGNEGHRRAAADHAAHRGDRGGRGQAAEEVKERHEKLSDDVDAILDEIDEVLEENAEEFVRSYVQKGGQ